MAYEGIGIDWTFNSSGDLSTKQYKVVKLHSDGTIVVSSQAVNTLDQIGILQDDPSAASQACQVRLAGISKAIAGGAINPGQYVQSDANGDVIAAVDGAIAIGVYIGTAAAADNDVIPVYLTGPAQAQV